MEITEIKKEAFATECKNCRRLLTNPGYHQQSRFCCGKYRRWYNTWEITIVRDDGRDERGRFHHAPGVISREKALLVEGGT